MTLTLRQISAGIVFGLLGYAANWAKLELFFGVDILFGSFFVMLALLLYGGTAGIIAGFMASLCTWHLWHHPWAVVSFNGEVLFAAWWLRTRSRDLIVPDILYWLCLGAPFLWISYHHLLGMEFQPTILVMLKQGINGFMNVLAATVAVQLLRFRSPGSEALLSLRHLLSTTIMTFVLFPTLLFLALDTWSCLRREEGRIVESMVRAAERSRDAVRNWLDNHYRNVVTLAELAGDPATTPAAILQQRADAITSGSLDFLRLGILDRHAVSVVVSPPGKSNEAYRGIDMSDRPYIRLIRETKKPAVADLVVGRLGAPGVILPMAAPILVNGDLKGFSIGAVDPSVMGALLKSLAIADAQKIILTDGSDRVIISSRPEVKTMEPYLRPSGWISRPLSEGVSQWVPRSGQVTNPMQRWRSSRYVKELPLGANVPWKIIVETTPAPMLAMLSQQSINSFSFLFGLIILTAGFSRLASDRLLQPLLRLQSVTGDLSRQIAEQKSAISWPESGISEIRGLIANFQEMADSLSRYVYELQCLNDSLEERIAQRTVALEEKSAFLKALLDSLPDRVFFKDRTSRYLGTNLFQARELGRTQEELVGATDDDLFTPEAARTFQENDRIVLETGRIQTFLEPVTLRDGRRFQAETVKAPLTLPSGEIIGLVGVARDITDRLRHEDELVQARSAAEAANRAKSAFLATMSHELRTPLNAILGLSEMLREGVMGELATEQRRALVTIEESGRHLLAIIIDILDLTQIEAERLELQRQKIDIPELCTAVLGKIRGVAEARKISINFRLSVVSPVLVTDPRRLRQIIDNLLNNAVKFTPRGGEVTLTVTGDRDRGEIRFEVADTGIGIAPDNLDKIFQPFFQADSRLSRKYEGTGLGLALVSRLAELLGGGVAVASESGKGSRFTVTLPWISEPEHA